jgi:uncharacterized protein
MIDDVIRWGLRAGALALSIYLAALVILYIFQRDLQYHPNATAYTPEKLGLRDVEVVSLPTSDGETIMSWYAKASAGRPTILYFHGNGGGLSNRSEKIGFFAGSDFGILAVSYRGYEGSTGSPSEAGFIIDANTAYDWLVAQGVKPSTIMLLGESLGSGVAVQLAAAKPVAAVALEAPYANAVDIGAAAYWYFPVHMLMQDQFRSTDFIARVKAPLLVTHGADDEVIPIDQGRELFALANEPKQMAEMPGARHGDVISGRKIWEAEARFFADVLAGRLAAK